MRLLYPGDVTHIMDGGSYYKALRANFLIDCALCCYLFEDKIAEQDLEDMASYIAKCSIEKLGTQDQSGAGVIRAYKKEVRDVSSNSRTAALWTTYHGFICLIKDFIRAERLHDFELHLAIVAKMLPIFAAAGRGQYSKALRLYLEQMTVLEIQYGALVKTFKVVGPHTVDIMNTSGLVCGQTCRSNSD